MRRRLAPSYRGQVAHSEVRKQIAAIREKVNRDGGCTVGCDELRVLCPDYLTVSEQFARIAEIARVEGWSFAFLEHGAVRFGAYSKA